ncbi:LamG-like jellyroll fold domain-containing protein [Fischerella sp. PCC 9605]|uniref:LamG-like jellyroll fold domain-containing protein n=1 Tax=Fischerella sp. PCC 9605 TaxID=1173024 RepID=UPI000478B149|nr:LamG-like jellyroll fold domain-containing protein [Fischerella sp. PCC 9605]
MQPQWDNYLQTYTNKAYQYTTLVEHTGVLISFAMDSVRRIYYTVLDQQNDPQPIDARNWSPSPQELIFPNEITQVGFGILPNKVLPTVRSNDQPAINPSEIDLFRSTTARLTADAPFQVLSDGQYIYLFRQSIDGNNPDNVTVINSDNQTPIPIVNQTLLVDRFILSGTQLKTAREVRYRRSRHKIIKSGAKDTLGATDMNNRPFYEPTMELDFIRNLVDGQFTVLQVPTSIPDIKRWQIFVHNQLTDRIDAYNIERSADGFFNTQGTESPDAFEKMGYAETALRLDADTYIAGKAQVLNKKEFNISAWIKPETTGVIYSEGTPEAVFQISLVETQLNTDGQVVPGYGVQVTANSKTVTSAANVIKIGQWNHISISVAPAPDAINPPANSGVVKIQVGDAVVNGDGEENQYLLFPTTSEATTYMVVGRNVGSLYGGSQSASPIVATVDELSIWERERSEIEVTKTKKFRKAGNEPGLLTYWQFDEGNGTTVYDRTDALNNGSIQGQPQWVQSDAPVGDNPGIQRTSFGFGDRTVAGKGISALLYYQQEELPSGHNGTPAPVKQNARVMVAVATASENDDKKKIAVLDFAVSKRGRLSQIPDNIRLPLIETKTKDPNTFINQIIQLEQTDILNTQREIASLNQQISTQQATIQRLIRDRTNREQLKANLENGKGVTGYSQPGFTGVSQRLGIGEHPTLRIAINSVKPDPGLYILLYEQPNFQGSSRAQYEDENRLGSTYFLSNYMSAKVLPTSSFQYQLNLYNSEIANINQQITNIQTVIIPNLNKQLTAQTEHLQNLQAQLADLRAQLQGKFAFPMQLIHIDSNGFNLVGGLLDFAWTNDAPQLFESANGMLRLYFRGSADQFFAVTYDTNVARASISLSNSVELRERSPGLGRSEIKVVMGSDANPDGTTVNITDGADANTCSVTLENSLLKITETWERVPRSPMGLARVLSGKARDVVYLGRLGADVTGTVDTITLAEPVSQRYEQGATLVIGEGTIALRKAIAPGDKEITIAKTTFTDTLPAGTTINLIEYDYDRYSNFSNTGTLMNAPYNLKYGSVLVEVAGVTNAGNIENLATRPLTGLSQPNTWITNTPGNALQIRNGHLSGDATELSHQGDISLEAWIRPDKEISRNVTWIVSQNSPTSRYCLGVQGQPVNSALQFNGQSDYIQAANINLANQSFTVEFWAKRDSASLNAFFSAVLTQGKPTNNNQLHFGFRQNGVFSFAFYGNDLNTPTGVANDTNWHHWACTFDAQSRKRIIYRDGTLVAEDTATAAYQGTGALLIATIENPTKQFYFQGAIDEIRIWGKVRSQAEINNTRDCRLNGNESGLRAYYHFEDRTASDRTGNTANDGQIFGTLPRVESGLTAYNVVAGVRNRYVTTTEPMWTNSWEHIAATYAEAYALRFNGVNSYLDCGNQVSLGVDNQLTIELTVTLPAVDRAFYPLLQKGRIGRDNPELTCWLYLRRDSASSYSLCFGYEDNQSQPHLVIASVNAPTPGTPVNIAVTGRQSDNGYTINLYWNGELRKTELVAGSGKPVTNLQPLEVGKCDGIPQGTTIANGYPRYLLGTISALRVWNRALARNELHQSNSDRDKLAGEWRFNEGSGNTTANLIGNNEARIIGATWVPDPSPTSTKLEVYINGMPAQIAPRSAIALPDNQFTLGRDFRGAIDEVRIWKQFRTQEQILDNLFGQLKGERENLLAYYEFESDPTTAGKVTTVNDSSLRGNHLTASNDADIQHTFSQAPLSDEIPLVRNALGSVSNRYQTNITSRPAIAEYADIQTANDGEIRGVHKRCYCFVQNGHWYLLTGYKLGNLITEWISQVQFAPQIKGFIEGAPPVPSKNLTAGPIDDSLRDYVDTTSVEFVEADSVSYTLSASKDSSFNSSFEGSLSLTLEQSIETVIAPFGGGITIELASGGTKIGQSVKLDTELKWSSNQQQSNKTNVSKMTTVGLGGAWEDSDINRRLNKAMARRYQPSNVGFALVESETADVYAIRLAHNRALVAFRMVPNPDIPKDTNIIPFPINPRYTKQGTLDGAVGYDQNGKVLDPDYPEATTYGEYSYFKPSEAYALRQRIQAEETRLRTYYEDFRTTPPGATGVLAGGVSGAIAGLAGGGPIVAAAGVAIGGLVDALTSNNDLPEQYSKRNLVNSYVWTADGGLYAESTETTDVQQESTSGAYSFTGSTTTSASGSFGLFGAEFDFEVKGSFGGSLNLTKAKTKEASQSFRINLKNNTQGDLQRFRLDERGNLVRDEAGRPIREYDANGNPLDAPGKVNAYRFLSFYLTPDTQNYDAFFNNVVDPIWLEENNSPNAQALRQARQPQGGPACWRIFHRVTFVSRILPEFPDPTAPPLDRAIQNTDLSSSYELIKLIEPFVRNATANAGEFDAAVRNAIHVYLPELSESLTQEVVLALANYFDVEGVN